MGNKAAQTATGNTAMNAEPEKARTMLNVFASVGARSFDVTLTDIDEEPHRFERNRSLEELRRTIAKALQAATTLQQNYIIRPRSTTATPIQLDDLDAEKIERLKPYAFMVIRTSPGNHQVWVGVTDAPREKEAAKDFARRLRKGVGADTTASGATRIGGSLNFKHKYAPTFPVVEIAHTNPGNVTNCSALEQAGFVARAEAPCPPRPAAVHRVSANDRPSRKKWPSYAFCIQHAPPTHGEDRPDVSRADFTWCRTAIEWGWGVQDTARRLMELSTKAKQNGEHYAVLTATNAAESVERQPYRAKSTPRPA
jgi:hypothetical protein